MAFIGKSLILLFGALSLMCLIWAAMVFTQKMDFVTPKDQAGKKLTNRVEQAQKKTRDLLYSNDRAFTRWSQNFDDLVRAEVDRAKRRNYYAGQIDILLTGSHNGMPVKVQKLVDPDDTTGGLLPLDDDKVAGREPEMFRGKTLETISSYEKGLADAEVAVNKLIMENKMIQEERMKATNAINGKPPEKGLRTRIKEQEEIEAFTLAESLYLDDYITNRRAEAQLFVKRRDSLQARVAELKKFFKIRDEGGVGNRN